jgi:hypothetical protein
MAEEGSEGVYHVFDDFPEPHMEQPKVCEWKENDPWGPTPDTYDGTCGICYTVDKSYAETFAEHELNYCPKCGNKIREIPFQRDTEDDE